MRKKILYYILLVLLILVASCVPKKKIPEHEVINPVLKGDMLWKNKEFKDACEEYKLAFHNNLIPGEKEVFYLKRVINCCLKIGDLNTAYIFLNKWKSKYRDSYYKDWEFHSLYLNYLYERHEKQKYESYLIGLLKGDYPYEIQQKTFLTLEQFYIENFSFNKAREVFKNFYVKITKVQQEEILRDFLNIVKQRQDIISKIDISQLKTDILPDSLILWSKVNHMVLSGRMSWIDGYSILYRIVSENKELKFLLQSRLEELVHKFGIPRIEIALLLPFGDGYRDVSYGILRGVEASIWGFEAEGIDIHVVIINTSCDNWEKEITSLDGERLVVGGPIRLKIWNEILTKGLLNDHYFFAFRSDLPMEGEKGYRFFPSHEDQVKALIDYFKDNFNITEYGIFYPKSKYGHELGEVFFNKLKEIGGKVLAMGWYDPSKQNTWQKKVGKFLGASDEFFQEKDKNKIKEFEPDLDFKGVFIPDSFENARIIIPNFFYFNANDLFFLGPTLWGTGHRKLSGLDFSMFKNAYYPSPWKDDLRNNQLNLLKRYEDELSKQGVDFWTCLGYDFVRFASRFQERINRQKKDVIFILNDPGFKWTIAPISWDNRGIAHQHMYVLNVVRDR